MLDINVLTGISQNSDTNRLIDVKVDTTGNIELTGDFRYDNLFKYEFASKRVISVPLTVATVK
jgi:hypothetical protein